MADTGFFDGLMRWDVPAHGVQVPLFFRDLAAVATVHTASSEAVRPLLPDALKPVETLPGRCLFVVAALQYRDSDLGPYQEFAFAVPAAPRQASLGVFDALKKGLSGSLDAWVWRMPVDSEVSLRVGTGLAGFPKSLADIRLGREGGRLLAGLWHQGQPQVHQGQPQVQLDVAADDAPGDRTLTLRAYTLHQGVLLQSAFVLRQLRWRDHLQRDAGRLVLGAGPLADALRGLSLSDRPLASHACGQAQALLFHPRNLRDH
jgi:hypothetical protein